MRRLMACLSLCSFVFMGTAALAQINSLNEVTSPTEVGTTTLPSGNYMVTDQRTGKSYALTVTERGTMVLAPEGMQGANARPKRSFEREVERGVENMIK